MFCSKREALIVKVLMSLKSFTWALSDGIGIYFSEDELQWDFSPGVVFNVFFLGELWVWLFQGICWQ